MAGEATVLEKRKRRDPRREATREALIEAAEAMIGEVGPEGVSLRQIGAAVGSLNKNVVVYHFGSKDALIEAIYHHRLPGFEKRRRALLAEAEAAGSLWDIETLLRVVWQPLFEQTNEEGKHSYACFLMSIIRSGFGSSRRLVSAEYPVADRLVELIDRLLPTQAKNLRNSRWFAAHSIVLNSLWLIDSHEADNPLEKQRIFEDALAMAASALTAPTSSI